MIQNCDMCGTKIEDGKCSCGTWESAEEAKENPMRNAIEHFHGMKRMILTGDAPHLGCAVVFFRGDCKDCEEVQKFILKMKGRPHYNDH